MKNLSICLVVVVMTSVSMAQGQVQGTAGKQGNSTIHSVSPAQIQSPCIVGRMYHPATPQERNWLGMAQVIKAEGCYNLLTSKAMIHVEEAQGLRMENRQKKAETYFVMRDVNQKHRDIEYKALQEKVARSALDLDGHSDEDVNGSLINIEWPSTLKQPKFAGYRKLVERILAKQAVGHKLTVAERSRLMTANSSALTALKNAKEDVSAADLDMTKEFVENLVAGHTLKTNQLAADK